MVPAVKRKNKHLGEAELTRVAGRLVGLLHKAPGEKFLIATDSNRTGEDEAAGTAAVVLRRGQEGHFEAARGMGRADRSSLEADSVTFTLRVEGPTRFGRSVVPRGACQDRLL